VGTTAITRIENIPASSASVYDLEVEDAHNYFANGIKVSNSAARSYRDIFKMCDHIYFRYGMTGTHFRSGSDDFEMWGLLSNTIYKVESADLLKRGFLVPTRIVFLPVLSKKLRGVPKGYITGHGRFGIHEHDDRNQMVATAAWILEKAGRKVLILVGTKSQGYQIRSLLRTLLAKKEGAQFEPVEFVSTDVDRSKQGRVLEAFLESREVNVLIGTSLLGEGVDLPIADALVYARGESAEVSLIQNAYRVGTAVPGKADAVIVDFADRHHRKLLTHSHERLNTYLDESTFSVDVLQSTQQFGDWLHGNVTTGESGPL
jgi:superfamily II DNA or RNA helicase